ncbi:hypothetical protein HPP92_025646 [Vanilla planifolia]|uniref:Uncharacterized protein n=1 Tax=Vanilla planifolia TaxID=51239 RepID=A0A835PK39_VANPL|nr:hypothetical protein HPP92_025903 [Vanilla planifolia]KAG0454342.1 hypothetical protein HPP92_025646 [Vanilla planifolia]
MGNEPEVPSSIYLKQSVLRNWFTGFKEDEVRAENQESSVNLAADAFANIKHVLLPITDRNPYLSEGVDCGLKASSGRNLASLKKSCWAKSPKYPTDLYKAIYTALPFVVAFVAASKKLEHYIFVAAVHFPPTVVGLPPRPMSSKSERDPKAAALIKFWGF